MFHPTSKQKHQALACVCSPFFPIIIIIINAFIIVTILPVSSPPALSLSMLIWQYVHQFVKMNMKEALQYVYCVCLVADQDNRVSKETLESTWELVRRIIVLAHSGPAWDELVGGF